MTTDSELEEIKHAAVKSECGVILFGKCHADCFKTGINVGLKMSSKADDQGFFTTRGRFVRRKEAADIALKARQVYSVKDYLFSEDLWSDRDGGLCTYDSISGYVLKRGKSK